MRLGIDLDGVVCNFADPANSFLAHWTDSEKIPTDNWNWFKGYPNGADAWRAMWEWAERTHAFAMLPAYYGAVENMRYLGALGYDITFITHRPTWAEDDTRAWLRKHNLAREGGNRRLVLVENAADKAKHSFDVVLDDFPATVTACREAGMAAFLYRRPWNTEAWDTEATVESWSEFRGAVGAVAKGLSVAHP